MPASGMNNTLPIAAQHEKTLWDWLELIVVPLSLVVVAALLRDREIRREAREKDFERLARSERYREDALQAYFNEMAHLILKCRLLDKSLANDAPAWKLAQLRTGMALRRMTDENGSDSRRIAEILTYIRDTGLLVGERGLLAGANLTKIVLSETDLSGANLENANLDEANLKGTNLTHAKLNGVKLRGAELGGANLSEANMQEARLWKAKLQGAKLEAAMLQEANLAHAELQKANLHLARLQKTNLTQARLQGVRLLEANLQGANLTNTEFDKETVLPDGTRYVPNETDMSRYTNPSHSDFWQPEWVKEQQTSD